MYIYSHSCSLFLRTWSFKLFKLLGELSKAHPMCSHLIQTHCKCFWGHIKIIENAVEVARLEDFCSNWPVTRWWWALYEFLYVISFRNQCNSSLLISLRGPTVMASLSPAATVTILTSLPNTNTPYRLPPTRGVHCTCMSWTGWVPYYSSCTHAILISFQPLGWMVDGMV